MKKSFRCILLTGTLFGMISVPIWPGNMNAVHAYIYGITDVNNTDYPLSMKKGVNLCYTTSSDEAVYIDETSAYAAGREKDVFYFVANAIRWQKARGTPNVRKENVSMRRETFAYDTAVHRMYRLVNGEYFALPERADRNSSGDVKTSLAIGMQIWHAVRKQDWQTWGLI